MKHAMPKLTSETITPDTLADVDLRIRAKATSLEGVRPSLLIYANGDELLELRQHRFVRFRARGGHDPCWVGSRRLPMDCCFSYNDVAELAVEQVSLTMNDHGFHLLLTGRKPSVDGHVYTSITATWDPERAGFVYELAARMCCDHDRWHQVSHRSRKRFETAGDGPTTIEPFNFHIEGVSVPDRLFGGQPYHSGLYEAFVREPFPGVWERVPKLTPPDATRYGNYLGLNFSHQMATGEPYGFLDREHGGWLLRVLDHSSPAAFGLCWMYFDVHFLLRDAIPARERKPRSSAAPEINAAYRVRFEPVLPETANQLLDGATELDWRNQPAYQVPVFQRENKFDRLVSGSEYEWPWFASSPACQRDDTVGYDDLFSARIQRTGPGADAWYAWCWGFPYDEEWIAGRYTLSAHVKLENCTGLVRIAVAHVEGDYWLHSDVALPSSKPVEWHYSEALSGTQDWTRLTVTRPMQEKPRDFGQCIHHGILHNMIVLEVAGPGTAWFDNVTLQPT